MTKLHLSEFDEAMVHGEFGPGAQTAMRIITRIAAMQGAERLIDISHVHVGGSIYTGPASLAVIERLVDDGAKVRVPTTLNAISVDEQRWYEHGVDESFARQAIRLANAFRQLGASPSFSCTPYALPGLPEQGADIVWAESNAITYANSVLGARTNRHGDFLDICAAITGRAPQTGLHLPEHRRGALLVELPAVDNIDDTFFTALGYLVGKQAYGMVPVIAGLNTHPSMEQLKAFCAAVSTAGPVGLVHIVGVTPEAPTLHAAFDGRPPQRVLQVTEAMLVDTTRELTTGHGTPPLDFLALGSPHFTLGDFEELARLVQGKKAHPRVTVTIMTSRHVLTEAQAAGLVEAAEQFGARISTDTCLCMLNDAMLPSGTETVMTCSGKFAHYGPGLIDRHIWYGSLADCIVSAISGVPVIQDPVWAATHTGQDSARD